MRTFAPENAPIAPGSNLQYINDKMAPMTIFSCTSYSETVYSMKNFFFFAAAVLVLLFESCENKTATIGNLPPVGEKNLTPGSLPPGKSDSLAGFRGCERGAWSALSADSEEFIYQHYVVVIKRKANGMGEELTVRRDSGRADFVIPMPENGYFHGVCRNKLFVDAGTGPDKRDLFIFDLDKMTQTFTTPYCGELRIVQSERLWFYLPVEESEVTKKPECPQQEEWSKNGWSVGYGQVCIFNFMNRSLTRKSEWACVPLQ